jgi:hypothetical protein
VILWFTLQKEQKLKFFHHASFFRSGNIHHRGSFLNEWGVQNLFIGERSVDSVIIRSIDLVCRTLFVNLLLWFGKMIAGEAFIMIFMHLVTNRYDYDLHPTIGQRWSYKMATVAIDLSMVDCLLVSLLISLQCLRLKGRILLSMIAILVSAVNDKDMDPLSKGESQPKMEVD